MGAGGYNQFKKKYIDENVIRSIQEMYDNGAGIKHVAKHFNISVCKLYSLRDDGLIRLHRTKEESNLLIVKNKVNKKHTEATKQKLSLIRKKWIADNPDKSPYLMSHKSRGETYSEKYFREWLEKEGIQFQQEYKFKSYSFDFLVNERIDLEIDGGQHKNDKRIIEHDIKRDAISKEFGFIVYRIIWSDYQKLSQDEKKKFLCDLKVFLIDTKYPIPYYVIKKKQSKLSKKC